MGGAFAARECGRQRFSGRRGWFSLPSVHAKAAAAAAAAAAAHVETLQVVVMGPTAGVRTHRVIHYTYSQKLSGHSGSAVQPGGLLPQTRLLKRYLRLRLLATIPTATKAWWIRRTSSSCLSPSDLSRQDVKGLNEPFRALPAAGMAAAAAAAR